VKTRRAVPKGAALFHVCTSVIFDSARRQEGAAAIARARGLADVTGGRTKPAEEVFTRLERKCRAMTRKAG
jgi:hypothetical protein